MMIRKYKLLQGVALSTVFACVFSLGIAAVYADENSGADTGSSTGSNGGRKTPWVRAHDLAAEQKTQVENDSAKKGALEDRQAKREENMADWQQNFCTKMIERNAKMSEHLNSVQRNILDRKMTRQNVFDENRDERDVTLEKNRSERDAKREDMYARLLNQAGDDADKKAAVTTFRKAVEKTISKRQQTIDAAIVAFRTGVDAAIGTKKTTIDASLSTFKSAMDGAFATAKSDCASGVDPVTVRETLQSSLKDAKATVGDQRKDSDAVGEQVKILSEAKKLSFSETLSDFKLALEQARTDLKAALGTVVQSPDESSS